MITPTITTMKPEQILRKAAFKRIKPTAERNPAGLVLQEGTNFSTYNPDFDPLRFDFYTQSDFMREYDINAHAINSLKEYPDQFMWMGVDDGGSLPASRNKYVRKVQTRIAQGWQQYIHGKRVATLTGNNIDLTISNAKTGGNMQETLALFQEGWKVKGLENAVYRAISADLKVGDAAIYFFKDKESGELEWKDLSFENGDTLYPHYDPMSQKLAVFGRKHIDQIINDKGEITSVTYLDVWDKSHYMRYVMDISDLSGGWRVDIEPMPHGFPFVPIAYHRYGAPCWAASQATIEKEELALSQLAENNAQYALRILLLMGADIDLQSSVDGTPMIIQSPEVDAKASFLEPSDSSSSFELQLKKYEDAILRDSFVVKTPEVKSGSDMSSLTVKMLFAESFQKALLDAQEYQGFLNDLVRIFKEGYGVEIGRTSEFTSLKVTAEILPYVFMSETEIVNSIVQLVGIGALSRKSASEIVYRILGYGNIDEAKRVLQEEHDALVPDSQANVNVVNNARNEA